MAHFIKNLKTNKLLLKHVLEDRFQRLPMMMMVMVMRKETKLLLQISIS